MEAKLKNETKATSKEYIKKSEVIENLLHRSQNGCKPLLNLSLLVRLFLFAFTVPVLSNDVIWLSRHRCFRDDLNSRGGNERFHLLQKLYAIQLAYISYMLKKL